MKNTFLLFTFLLLLVLSACQKDDDPEPVNPARSDIEMMIADAPVNPYQLGLALLAETGWPQEETAGLNTSTTGNELMNYRREVIAGDIVHYAFEVKMGTNPNDKIGIHRVVREESAGRPIKTARTLFFQHGDAKDFEGMMLPGAKSATTANDFGMAVYLARNDVDVWGIDQAWTLTPKETPDLSFMADWGLQKQITDLRQAMSVARITRFLTGNGLESLILAGYSSGSVTGYSTLNEETQLPAALQHTKGYIAVDLVIKTDDPVLKGFLQAYHAQLKSVYDGGQYADIVPFQPLGQLARNDPNGDSPIIPGFTNLQAALFYGAGPIFEVIPFHYLAGVWENDFPVALQYITLEQWFDFLESAPPYEALLFEIEWAALAGDAEDLPFDDHFAEITVPILNLTAGGGFGELSKYGTTLLGSNDVTHLIVSERPPEEVLLDFGHIDLFTANNAESLVWQPVLEWVEQY